MLFKKSIHWTIMVAFIVLFLATPKTAMAWSGCGSSYYVRPGDTLWSIANYYGTTVAALRQANSNLGYWIYAGQTLCIPSAYQGGYDYQSSGYGSRNNCYSNCYGSRYGNGYDNGYGNCTNNCYGNSYGNGYDNGYGNSYGNNYDNGYGNGYNNGYQGNGYASYTAPSWGGGTYCIQRGDTLKIIAARFGTTVGNLLNLNPQIWNPNWIYAGQVIRVW